MLKKDLIIKVKELEAQLENANNQIDTLKRINKAISEDFDIVVNSTTKLVEDIKAADQEFKYFWKIRNFQKQIKQALLQFDLDTQ